MRENTSSGDSLMRWHQRAAKHPGFIGFALALVRERNAISEEQQRAAVGIPLGADYDPVWLSLQAMGFPRRGEAFAEDVKKIAAHVTHRALQDHRLSVALDTRGMLELLAEAQREMAVQLRSLQPFAVIVRGLGTLLATNVGNEYLVYLPEGVDEGKIELHVEPGAGSEFLADWARRIRACDGDEQAAKLLTSFAIRLSEAMMNRAIDSMCDYIGVPRAANE